ncbi:uncharacterized protein LOC136027919 isoform X2 [Artemia franciscana]
MLSFHPSKGPKEEQVVPKLPRKGSCEGLTVEKKSPNFEEEEQHLLKKSKMENMDDDSKTVLFNYQQFCALSVEENSHCILGKSPNFKDERHLLKKSKMEISDDGSMFLGEKKLTKTLCDDIDEMEYESWKRVSPYIENNSNFKEEEQRILK